MIDLFTTLPPHIVEVFMLGWLAIAFICIEIQEAEDNENY
jgi:hypothetical protein